MIPTKQTDTITLLVKIRDAIDEYLETMNPNSQTSTTKIEHEKIAWIRTEGNKGPYERYPAFQQQPDQTNQNYVALLEKIKKTKFYSHNGLNYWIFRDNITIGRKPATQ